MATVEARATIKEVDTGEIDGVGAAEEGEGEEAELVETLLPVP